MKYVKPVRECLGCKETRIIIGRGYCSTCYPKMVPPSMRRQTRKSGPREPVGLGQTWPRAEMITIYHTSDGREHGSEVEALKWQLDIERAKFARVSR